MAVSPGFMRTEAVLAHHGLDEKTWMQDPALQHTESPVYVGRAIVALASDSQIMQKSGGLYVSGDLAGEYGFTDADGRVVPSFYKVAMP